MSPSDKLPNCAARYKPLSVRAKTKIAHGHVVHMVQETSKAASKAAHFWGPFVPEMSVVRLSK